MYPWQGLLSCIIGCQQQNPDLNPTKRIPLTLGSTESQMTEVPDSLHTTRNPIRTRDGSGSGISVMDRQQARASAFTREQVLISIFGLIAVFIYHCSSTVPLAVD
jgi:hypothetical protein